MNEQEKKELIQSIKDIERVKYTLIQKLNKLVLDIEKILMRD